VQQEGDLNAEELEEAAGSVTVQCTCYEVRPLVPGGECQIRESAALIHGLQLVWRSFSRIGIEASSTAARGKEEKFSGLPVRTEHTGYDFQDLPRPTLMTQLNEVPSIQEQELTKILSGNLPYSVPGILNSRLQDLL